MANTIVVTGAGGFVGSAVVRLAGPADSDARFWDGSPVEQVVAVVRPGSSVARLAELVPSRRWSVARADLADETAVRALLRKTRPRAIVHVAADAAIHSDLDGQDLRRVHLVPLEALLDGLADVGGERFVNTSSAWVLPSGARLDERTPLAPASPYARAKAAADRVLPALAQRAGLRWINLRPFNIFGKHEDERRLLPYLVSRLMSGEDAVVSAGSLVRDFTDVDEVARSYLCALRAPDHACDAVYHIGSGRACTIREFAGVVAQCVGGSASIRFGSGDVPDRHLPCQVSDPALAQRMLGWRASGDLSSRVAATVEWWLDRFHARRAGAR